MMIEKVMIQLGPNIYIYIYILYYIYILKKKKKKKNAGGLAGAAAPP